MGTQDSVRTPLGDRELEELPELLKINSPTQRPVVRVSKNGLMSPIDRKKYKS